MQFLEAINRRLNQILIWIGGFILGAMILLTCANVFLRIVWIPIRGTYELMGYSSALVIAFAMGYTQMHNGHIAVDIIVKGFSTRIKKVLHGTNCLICMVFFTIAGWQIIKLGTNLMKTGETSETLRIFYYPFTYGVAFGCFVMAFGMLVGIITLFAGEKEEK